MLELLWALLTSQEVLRPSEPRLSVYSANNELGSTIWSQTSLSSHHLSGRTWGVFIGCEEDLHRKLEVVWITWMAGRSYTWPVGQPSPPSGITDLVWHVYEMVFDNTSNPGWLAKEVGPVGPTLSRLGPGFLPHHSLVSYCLWLCFILDMMKICMDFGPYHASPSSDVPEMVDRQNSWTH
jgi:hypothetical protein